MTIKNLLYQTLYFVENENTFILPPKTKKVFADSVKDNETIKIYLKEKYIKIQK